MTEGIRLQGPQESPQAKALPLDCGLPFRQKIWYNTTDSKTKERCAMDLIIYAALGPEGTERRLARRLLALALERELGLPPMSP